MEIISAETSASEVWIQETALEDGKTRVVIQELDPGTGRRVAVSILTRSPDGSEIISRDKAFSSVEVFRAEDVPSSIFSHSTIGEECDDE